MRAILAVVVVVLATVGCSSERDSGDSSTSTPSTAPADSAAVSATTTAGSPDVSTTRTPVSSQPVVLSELGVAFGAPETYTPLIPTELGADFYGSDSFTELAERLEFDPAVFAQALRESLAILLFAPAEPDGYIDNISVTSAAGERLPDAESVTASIAPLDATDIEVTPIAIDGVPAVRAAYTRPGSSGDLHARDVIVETNGALTTISIVAATPDEADRVAGLVLDTFEVLPA
jgi:hypothetical protein